MAINPATEILDMVGVGPNFTKRLRKLGIKNVRDLLWHFPARYEDFSQIRKIADLEPGERATIRGTVEDVSGRRTWQRHMTIVEAVISDGTGSIRAVWFNQPYMASSLRPGRAANFAGKVSLSGEGEMYLAHPAYEIVGGRMSDVGHRTSETRHTARLVPVYPETRGLTSKGLRFLIQPILKNLERLPEWIPAAILAKNSLPEINRAVNDIHFPEQIGEALAAKKRFAFEDLFLLQLANLRKKLKLAREKAPEAKIDIERLKKVIAELPFALTLSQKKSLWEILRDMSRARPMNRLLQGDVGSGKTVIAVIAALVASENGLQTAFMAPTEILARQHFLTIKKLFSSVKTAIQPATCLLTSSEAKIFYPDDRETSVKKDGLLEKIKSGEIKIVVGTHALIAASAQGFGAPKQKTVAFKNPGLVVVDEQHRFGVRQRAALVGRSAPDPQSPRPSASLMPHLLSMSATPIPRTLMLSVFGDLDVSFITELPAGRKNIATKIVPPDGREKAYGFIRGEIRRGRQAFVICPRIESAQANTDGKSRPDIISPRKSALIWEVKSVKEEYEKLSKKIFPGLRVAMLHGRLKPKEKEAVMKKFAAGESDLLVSTSVVEVGVDIPNATVMMIEGADRFGLAQLYQFRGRVGRGAHQSYCLLFADSASQATAARLRAIAEAKNGFELAERDLKQRGPGEFLGEAQSGFSDIVMNALRDPELVRSAHEAASEIIRADTGFSRNPLLRAKLDEFEKTVHAE